MLVKKGGRYKTGLCRIRGIVDGDLQKQIDFDEGKDIEVDEKQLAKLKKLDWIEEVKDGEYESVSQ